MNCLSYVGTWVQIFANIAITIAVIFGALQLRLSSKTSSATLLRDLFDKNAELRNNFNNLRDNAPPYDELVDQYPDVFTLRTLPQLEPLFQIGHHYEYIGLIVKKRFIKLEIVFELIPVDKDIWVNSEPIRNHLRKHWLADWWDNWEYLHNKYEKLRNKRKRSW
jgi:hypothetical protein